MTQQTPLFLDSTDHLLPGDEEALSGDHGEIFTRRWVVELILDLCGYTSDRDLARLKAVEPACGSGAFLLPMVDRLLQSMARHGRSPLEAKASLQAFDLLSTNVEASRSAVADALERAGSSPSSARGLTESWVTRADFLLSSEDEGTAELVVGNPPYIRLEAVPRARSEAYRRACPAMGGRADVYVGFYERGLRLLKPNGALGFICADRWMRNAYGARLRAMISNGWSVDTVIGMTGVDVFEDEVDAYPAITVIRRRAQSSGPLVVDTSSGFGPTDARLVSQAATNGRAPRAEAPHYRAARLPRWFEGSGGWPHGSPGRLAALADLEERLPPLQDEATGTRVGIGVASGADRVFIVRDSNLVEKGRLLPLALPSDIASGALEWSGRYLVNPWDSAGLVELEEWPRFAAYLGEHREQLSGRHTARSGRWHKTIDRVIPGLQEREKLYLPDFKEAIFPVLDPGTTYPHHNLYWVTSAEWDLPVLGGLLLSDVANFFIESYSVRMRGGFLRFQAQYLRRIRLPRVGDVDADTADGLARAFAERDRHRATQLALPLYGLREIPR